MGEDVFKIVRAFAATVVVLFILAAAVVAQDTTATPTVAEQSPVVVVESMGEIENWIDSAFKVVLAGIGLILSFAIKQGVQTIASMLPTIAGDFVRGWMDEKRQKDLHSSIMSQVSTIIKEGRWTGNARDVLLEIKRNIVNSVPQAAEHFGINILADEKMDAVLANIANRKAVEVQEKVTKAIAESAMAAEVIKNVGGPTADKLTEALTSVFSTVKHPPTNGA